MSQFVDSHNNRWIPTKLPLDVYREIPARGGASVVNVNNAIYIFGGADRKQTHFNDLWVIYENPSYKDVDLANNSNNGAESSDSNLPSISKIIECTGDIPNERSDHSMIGYRDNYILLFGGKNHEGEYCFNDLYILDLTTKVWKYVGEMGEEIELRCGHSFGLLCSRDTQKFPDESDRSEQEQGERAGKSIEIEYYHIVVYGGSNPENGTCNNDTYYASLPNSQETVELEDIYVTWHKVTTPCPPKREMHATCTFKDCMYICGGMSMDCPTGLSDTWKLTAAPTGVSNPEADGSNKSVSVLSWSRCSDMELPMPLFGHAAAVTNRYDYLCVMCGVSGENCIVEDMLVFPLAEHTPGSTESQWKVVQWRGCPTNTDRPINFRLGLNMLSCPPHWLVEYKNEFIEQAPKKSKNALKKAKAKEKKKQLKRMDAEAASVGVEATEPDASCSDLNVCNSAKATSGTGEVSDGTDKEGLGIHVTPMNPASTISLDIQNAFNGVLVFGGVDQMHDYNDIWYFTPEEKVLKNSFDCCSASAGSSHSGLISVLS